MKKIFLFIVIVLMFCSCKKDDLSHIDFRQEMRNFVQEISQYSKNKIPNFFIIPQNGCEILSIDADTFILASEYISAIDGIGQESLFYGYDNDDQKTPLDVSNYLLKYFDFATENNLTILVTDYCTTTDFVDDSYYTNHNLGFISFAAPDRNLRVVPSYPLEPNNVSQSNITELNQVRNFLYLINPENFNSKSDFLNTLNATNYDIILIDLFFNDNQEYSKEEIELLKTKANGAKRLVICYMSIGEAEDYRFYWNLDWNKKSPIWLEQENPDWKGNYKVRYWETEWKNIIMGSESSYLDKIIDLEFDGVYLDIIDGFDFFETKYKK